jgi:pimeloyl-ACP methyl ester carboxylesterase
MSQAGQMSVESEEFTELGDEFALVAEMAAEAGVGDRALPRARRGWVNVPAGGHVSGVFWGEGHPEVVFLHDLAESARAWDAVGVTVGRPSVAIDLPGHGRSDWRRDGRYEPGRLASAVAEAIRSFAPRARLVVGSGLGACTAIALHRRHPQLLPRLALLRPLPGTAREWPGPWLFSDPSEAVAVLAARRPDHSARALRREILYELSQGHDGSWAWRHHPGNLPPPAPDAGPDDAEPLWRELAVLGSAAAFIIGDRVGPLAASDRARLHQHAPGARVIPIQGGGTDVIATRPAALGAALDQLLAQTAEEQA